MEEQSAAVQYVLPVTVAMIMFAMGLGLTVDDFRRLAQKPKAAFIGLFGQLAVLPVLAFGLAMLGRLPSELAVGMVLIAACPGGAHSNLFANLARGDVALSVTLTAVSSLITIVTIPFIVGLGIEFFEAGGVVPELPVGDTMFQVFVVMAVPVIVGMLVRARSLKWAARLEPVIKTVAIVLLLLIVVGSIARQADDVLAFIKQAGLAVLTLNIAAMALGLLMAKMGGLPPEQQRTITLEVGIQNGALAFALAAAILKSMAVAIPPILYSILVYFTGALVIVSGRRAES